MSHTCSKKSEGNTNCKECVFETKIKKINWHFVSDSNLKSKLIESFQKIPQARKDLLIDNLNENLGLALDYLYLLRRHEVSRSELFNIKHPYDPQILIDGINLIIDGNEILQKETIDIEKTLTPFLARAQDHISNINQKHLAQIPSFPKARSIATMVIGIALGTILIAAGIACIAAFPVLLPAAPIWAQVLGAIPSVAGALAGLMAGSFTGAEALRRSQSIDLTVEMPAEVTNIHTLFANSMTKIREEVRKETTPKLT